MAQQPQSSNVWGGTLVPNTQQNASSAFDATSVWGGGAAKLPTAAAPAPASFDLFATSGFSTGGNAVGTGGNAPKKDDAFGDLWGGFK